jgi:tetratricopeptide (TPR) repeat protein
LGEANVRQALGDLLMREDDLKGARAQYDAALLIYPAVGARLGEANVRRALGDLLMREADLKGARAQYDAALLIYPAVGDRLGEANVRQALGNLALAEKRIDEAIHFYTEAAIIHQGIQDRLGLAGAFGYLARAYLAAENPVQAVIYGEASINLLREIGERFGQIIALNDQGNALYALQLAEPAFAAWWQALGLAQRVNPPVAEHLISVFGQIKQAVGEPEFDALTQRLAQDAESIRMQGVQAVQAKHARDEAVAAAFEHYNAKRYLEARATFEEILNALPDDLEALNGLGNTLESLKLDDAALVAYGRAIVVQSETAMLRRNRANVLLRLGRYDEAELDVAVAVRLEPEHAFTRARQGYLALGRGQFAEAQTHLQAAVAADSENSAWPLGLALAHFATDPSAEKIDALALAANRADADDRVEALLWLERIVVLRTDLAAEANRVREILSVT